MSRRIRPARRLVTAAAIAVGVSLLAHVGTPAQGTSQAQPPQGAQPPQQRPVFRAGTHFVQVDAYPRRDGKVVEGLTAKDFEVFEDGRVQSIESLEFIRVDLNTPESERRDPATKEEGDRLAADPRNRAFVLYLDHYHSSLHGSHELRRPIVDMLNRMLSPNDVFAVATVLTTPRDLLFGRKTRSIEDQLERYWTWGLKTTKQIDLEPEEIPMMTCYGEEVAGLYARRMREWRTLDTLAQLVGHLGLIREARKVVVVFTTGWPLATPDPATLNRLLDLSTQRLPQVGVGPGGRLMTPPANMVGVADWARCNSELTRALMFDNRRKFFALLDEANQNNVTFYPVNPNGLTGGREDVLRTLANNTDGFTSLTNDLGDLLRRITDDVSAYYVLGYYSDNTKQDGRYRKIEVKMKAPGVDVKARRGYFSPMPTEASSPAVVRPTAPEGLTDAMDVLSRLRPSSELFTFGAANAADVVVVVELASNLLASGGWAKGGDVEATVTTSGGAVGTARARIEPGLRSAMVRIPKPGDGPYHVTIRVTAGADQWSDQIEIASRRGELIGSPLLFRATPSGQSALRPVADLQYRRTERAHIEWPLLEPLDRREARLLARDGRALAVPVTLTEREQNGAPVLAADANLAPLAAGDYVIELTVGAGAKTERRFLAIRVRQ